ncbi:MAG: N-acetylmuramoyl-L-alanine amidase [Armatimonadetes bacterium]|nr:N-acetylmuramoyl-L-alanine amidase [Armatimonadota bacterium]MDW8122706.1 N-acetylmuramoyl-L-alanine amidase [Armatimonadota bacterium]
MPQWSPNRSPRPKGVIPTVIVLHSTEGAFDGAVSWLSNPQSNASAHFVIGRDGRIAKLVPLSDAAWHVRGQIKWAGSPHSLNAVSIGIELEAYPGAYDYPDSQLNALADVVRQICRTYPIEAVIAHKHCDPKRRSDPTHFPWKRFWSVLLSQK